MAEEYDNLTLFAAIKTLHAQGNDLLSAISALVLQCIESNSSFESIEEKFKTDYLTDIPEDSLKTVLKRLKSTGLVEYGSKFSGIKLKSEGTQQKIKLQSSVSGLRRDFSSLVQEMRAYYKNNKYSAPDNFEKELLLFIDQNVGYASSLMRGNEEKAANNSIHVASYITHLEQSSPDKFKLLQNVFFGRVYINIIKTRDTYAKNVSLESTKVYLDTNILLSILGFHDASSKKQADELLNILSQTQKIDVLVFDETVTEARLLLQAAGREMNKYTDKIPVDSIYFRLKRDGHSKESITILMEGLEESIQNQGIKIVTMPIIDEESAEYKNLSADIGSEAARLDRSKADKALRHDARVLSAIKMLRKNMHSKLFEKSQQLFVTPDVAINSVTHKKAKESFFYPLSISVTEIVSTLWMRNIGNSEIATSVVRQSIMAYVRERAISHDLWEKFISTIDEAAQQKRLSKDDIAVLMSDEETSRILAEKQYDAPAQLVSDKYIESLRDTREKDIKEKELAMGKVDNVATRIDSFSGTIATLCAILAGLFISAILTSMVYAVVGIIGLDNFANGWGLASILFIVIVAITFGVQFRVSHLVSMRSKAKKKIKAFVSKRVRRVVGIGE